MNTSTKKQIILQDIMSEIKSLRREVSLFLPTESLNEYTNKKEILAALKNARK